MRCILFHIFLLANCHYFNNAMVQYYKTQQLPLPGPAQSKAQPVLNSITQYIDHFNILDDRTYQMRYLTNDEFYETGGPMYIFVGGEWDISIYQGYLLTGQMFEMAKKTNGIMYHPEHRFYGESHPFPDLTTKSLYYLNVDQALADLAYFIEDRKNSSIDLQSSKVVLVGGSYAGVLATWMRLKYPSSVDAALASGAPVLAIAEFEQYYDIVGKEIYSNSIDCWNLLSEATLQIDKKLDTPIGILEVSEKFASCEFLRPIFPNRAFFFESLINVFGNMVKFSKPGTIKKECDAMLAKEGTPLDKMAEYVRDIYNGSCIVGYNEYIEYYSQTDLEYADAFRQLFYQTCTEFGFYQITSTPSQPFGLVVPKELSQQMCIDLYGPEFTPALTLKGIERTNIEFGGINPEVTHVVHVHGTADPWHSIGILNELNEDSPAIVIKDTSHCADLNSADASDPPELTAARIKSQEFIFKWIL